MFAGERQQHAPGGLIGGVCRGHGGLDDVAKALRIDRETLIEVPRREAAGARVKLQRDFARCQRSAGKAANPN
jgi:hypothetical protein